MRREKISSIGRRRPMGSKGNRHFAISPNYERLLKLSRFLFRALPGVYKADDFYLSKQPRLTDFKIPHFNIYYLQSTCLLFEPRFVNWITHHIAEVYPDLDFIATSPLG